MTNRVSEMRGSSSDRSTCAVRAASSFGVGQAGSAATVREKPQCLPADLWSPEPCEICKVDSISAA